jgi:hypothetical protein
LNGINSYRAMGFGIYPQEWVFPVVSQFDLHGVIAFRTPGASCFENCVGALTIAVNSLKYEFSAFIPRDSRWRASFAEGSHFPG